MLAIAAKLYACFIECDAMLCEVNPLVVTPDGEVRALDSKFTIDDNALFRHPDIAEMRDLEAYPAEERAARAKDVTYVKLDGEVGILGNGAGLVMSTLDVVGLAGGRAANFCDLGGGGDAEGVVDALEVIVADPQVRAILFNVFGGITRCDEVARGILTALERMTIEHPIVVRLDGTNAEEGRQLLADAAPDERPRGADDARGGEARRRAGRMTDLWSERAAAYRAHTEHAHGADLELVVDWCGAGPGVTVLDVATGGGHTARALRDAGCTVVTVDAAPGMQPDVISRAEELPFADGSFDVVVSRIAPHHFADVATAVREFARVARRTVVVEDTLFRERGDRGGRAPPRPDARSLVHARPSGVSCSRTPASTSRTWSLRREAPPARRVARPHRLRRRGRRACPHPARRRDRG